MKALLDAMQFKQIMDGCKHAVSTDNSRPILGYIKLDSHPEMEVVGNIYDNPELLEVED